MSFSRATVLLAIVAAVQAGLELESEAPVNRVGGSPYPAPLKPATSIVVAGMDAWSSPGEHLLAATLQGTLLRFGGDRHIYRVTGTQQSPGGLFGQSQWWLQQVEAQQGSAVSVDRSMEGKSAMDVFKAVGAGHVKGYVVAGDASDANVNMAAVSFVAGSKTPLVAISKAMAPELDSMGIPQVYDASGKSPADIFGELGDDAFSKGIVIYQTADKWEMLADYAVFSGAFMFTDSIGGPLFNKVLARMNPGGALFGWGDSEFDLVKAASQHNLWVNCADFAWDISLFASLPPVPVKAPQPSPRGAYLRNSVNNGQGKHTVTFVMSDGDNLQWLLNGFATDEKWYGSPLRGKLPMGWTVSAAAAETIAPSLTYLQQKATPEDTLIAGVSGVGYLFPTDMPDLSVHTAMLDKFANSTGMKIVNILDDTNSVSEAVAKEYLSAENVDAVFYYYYSNYAGAEGKMLWSNGKPAIGGRAMLWDGFNTPQSLADLLNKQSTDETTEGGYSVIPVHAWSMQVKDVATCISLLHDSVEVVTPAELVRRVKANVKH